MKRELRISVITEQTGASSSEETQSFLEGATLFANEHPEVSLEELSVAAVDDPPPPGVWEGIDGILAWLDEGHSWLRDVPLPKVNCTTGAFPDDRIPVVAYSPKKILMAVIAEAVHVRARQVLSLRKKKNAQTAEQARQDGILDRHLSSRDIGHRLLPLGGGDKNHLRLLHGDIRQETEIIQALETAEKPVLVWAHTAALGVLACRTARHLGLSIPDDVAVMTLPDTRLARFCDPPLTVIPLKGQEIGRKAMECLLKMIRGGEMPAEVVLDVPPVIRRASTCKADGRHDMARAEQLIRRYAPEGLTVQELADLMDMPRAALIRHFNEHFGTPPLRAIHKERTAGICRLLDRKELSLSEVARLCMFGYPNNLCRFFKKQTGMTLEEYRRRKQKP